MKKLNAIALFSVLFFFVGTLGVLAQASDEKTDGNETETEEVTIIKTDQDAAKTTVVTKVESKTLGISDGDDDLETQAGIKGEGQTKKEDVEELEDDDDDGDDGDD